MCNCLHLYSTCWHCLLWSRFSYLGVTTYLVVTEETSIVRVQTLHRSTARNALPTWELLDWGWQDVLMVKFYQTDGKTGLQKGEGRSIQGFWKGNNKWMFWKATCLVRNPLKHFSLLWAKMKDTAGRENFAVIHPWDDESTKSWGSFLSFRLQCLDKWTALSSQSLQLCLIISGSFC